MTGATMDGGGGSEPNACIESQIPSTDGARYSRVAAKLTASNLARVIPNKDCSRYDYVYMCVGTWVTDSRLHATGLSGAGYPETVCTLPMASRPYVL